jgi:hypothetical protein
MIFQFIRLIVAATSILIPLNGFASTQGTVEAATKPLPFVSPMGNVFQQVNNIVNLIAGPAQQINIHCRSRHGCTPRRQQQSALQQEFAGVWRCR